MEEEHKMTHAFEFTAGRETYTVTAEGFIGRACWAPTGQWSLRGLVRYSNFGTIVHRVEFSELAEFIRSKPQLMFKNGKPRYFPADVDHGTHRLWGNGVTMLREVN